MAATAVRKAYGDHVVLNGIDLDIPAGSIFALLGPNGAGKTTVVQILSTLISADAGQVRIAGHDVVHEPDAVRAAIGVTGQFSAVDSFLTGEENLLLMADLHHLPRRERRQRAADLLCVALAMTAKNVASASNLPMPLMILPMIGSGFVPTDSMSTGLKWFAEYQPFTPFIETLRGLLMGTPIGDNAVLAISWCAVITLGGYLWAKKLYNREPTR
ncbi:MAG TPA: ATP-binding cassette domain-containing protein [Mycobacterium sp.]|nr:ATP-binding cassette domain-containing protein [Mycobacterium sp.]